MSERETKGSDEAAALLRLNQSLNEQLKRLVRFDRQLSLSRNALADQLRRVRLLDEYALAASNVPDAAGILRLGLELLAKLFPFEQSIALLVTNGKLTPAAMHAVGGMRGDEARMSRVASLPISSCLRVRRAGIVAGADSSAHDADTRALLGCLDDLYPASHSASGHQLAVVLPLARRPGELVGVLVARRITRPQPYIEALPTDVDRDFLDVVGKQLAAAMTNAALVKDLRKSYADLAAAHAGLIERERLAAVGEMSAQIAHEVRNPLGAIFNSVSRLKTVLSPTGEPEVLLGILSEEAARLARIVDELLDFARPQAPALSMEGVDGVVRRAVDSAVRSGGLDAIGVTLELEAGDREVLLDARMIEQSLVNLVLNAAHAMEGRGQIVLRTSVERSADDCFVRIETSDTGSGVKPEIASRLFQPFFTTRASGTGLGLAVVKRFVEAHGGEVCFFANRGAGTTFCIRLPAGAHDADQAPPRRLQHA